MLRARTRERVDRLIVVADHAEIVAVAEPVLEQCLLEQVHVLVFVDRERAVLCAKGRHRPFVALEETHRALEQVLEVEQPFGFLAPLVVPVDTCHQVGGDRRFSGGGRIEIAGRADAKVLGPLDLRGEVAGRAELEGARQLVADLAQQERLRRQDATDLGRREVAQLSQRGRVEGSGADPRDAERGQAGA